MIEQFPYTTDGSNSGLVPAMAIRIILEGSASKFRDKHDPQVQASCAATILIKESTMYWFPSCTPNCTLKWESLLLHILATCLCCVLIVLPKCVTCVRLILILLPC